MNLTRVACYDFYTVPIVQINTHTYSRGCLEGPCGSPWDVIVNGLLQKLQEFCLCCLCLPLGEECAQDEWLQKCLCLPPSSVLNDGLDFRHLGVSGTNLSNEFC